MRLSEQNASRAADLSKEVSSTFFRRHEGKHCWHGEPSIVPCDRHPHLPEQPCKENSSTFPRRRKLDCELRIATQDPRLNQGWSAPMSAEVDHELVYRIAGM